MVVHCLSCYKPQEDIKEHLNNVCMVEATQAQIDAEVVRAITSACDWARNARTWDFDKLCALLPDRGCQVAMLNELLRLGFLVHNQPNMDSGEEAHSASDHPSSAGLSSTHDVDRPLERLV